MRLFSPLFSMERGESTKSQFVNRGNPTGFVCILIYKNCRVEEGNTRCLNLKKKIPAAIHSCFLLSHLPYSFKSQRSNTAINIKQRVHMDCILAMSRAMRSCCVNLTEKWWVMKEASDEGDPGGWKILFLNAQNICRGRCHIYDHWDDEAFQQKVTV